jgi:hypothetical protein
MEEWVTLLAKVLMSISSALSSPLKSYSLNHLFYPPDLDLLFKIALEVYVVLAAASAIFPYFIIVQIFDDVQVNRDGRQF